MPIISLFLTALLALSAIAAPIPASDVGVAALPQPDSATTNDLYNEMLGAAARAAAINHQIENVEAAQYGSAMRHLPVDDSAFVEGGLERRAPPNAGRVRNKQVVDKHRIVDQTKADAGNSAPLPLPETQLHESVADASAPAASDVDRSGELLETLRAALADRYQHNVFWKQSKLPHGYYKVAGV